MLAVLWQLWRPSRGLVLRVSWDYGAFDPPLMLFAFHRVPFYSGRNGQYREWHLLASNSTGNHAWPADPLAWPIVTPGTRLAQKWFKS